MSTKWKRSSIFHQESKRNADANGSVVLKALQDGLLISSQPLEGNVKILNPSVFDSSWTGSGKKVLQQGDKECRLYFCFKQTNNRCKFLLLNWKVKITRRAFLLECREQRGGNEVKQTCLNVFTLISSQVEEAEHVRVSNLTS